MNNDTYSRKLLNFNNERLIVWIVNEENMTYRHTITCVAYENAKVQEGSILYGAFGEGFDFESACKDYCEKISGCKLIFNPDSENRYEMYFL